MPPGHRTAELSRQRSVEAASLRFCDLAVIRITQRTVEKGKKQYKAHFADSRIPSSFVRENDQGVAAVVVDGRDFELRSRVIDLESDEASVSWKGALLSGAELESARQMVKTHKRKEQDRLAVAAGPLQQQTPAGDAFVPKRGTAYNIWLRGRLASHAGITPQMSNILSCPDVRDLVFRKAFIKKASTFDAWNIRHRQAGIIYATGVEQSMACSTCVKASANGSAPFRKCVVRPDVSSGTCACCMFLGPNEGCDFHSASGYFYKGVV